MRESAAFRKEIERAVKAIGNKHFIESDGLMAENASEIFRVSRPVQDINILTLADEYDCALEAVMALFLISSRDRESRIGTNLYAKGVGLLLWNPRWSASTKAKVWSLHCGLKIGCRDDLDFVIKIVCCFLKAEERGIAENWASYFQVNYQVIQEALAAARDILNSCYRLKAREKERNVDFCFWQKLRRILSVRGQEKIFGLQKQEPADFETDFFVDQRFPVGSWVKVREEKGKTYLEELIKPPEPLRLTFKKTLRFDGGKTDKEETTSFGQRLADEKSETKMSAEGIWVNEKKAQEARIVEWTKRGGFPVAILSSFAESGMINFKAKKGEKIEAEIKQVARDPVGKGGWILVQTKDNFAVPVEMSEMSISPLGCGLERLQGRTFPFLVKDFSEGGLPVLSRIPWIIRDLKDLKKEISESEKATKVSKRNFVELEGFAADIDFAEGKLIAAVPRNDGVLHSFEISQNYISGVNIENLQVGDEVMAQIFERTDHYELPIACLGDEEIENRPRSWRLSGDGTNVLVPWCVDDEEIEKWPARPEVIDFAKRNSWRYGFNARISFVKWQFSYLRANNLVLGVVREIEYESDGRTVKGIKIIIDDSGKLVTVSGCDLSSRPISKGDKIFFSVKTANRESRLLQLVEDAKSRKKIK